VPPRRKKGDFSFLAKLGENIRRERIARQLTQEQLAEKLDLHPTSVQKLEYGELNPNATTLARIQAVLQCAWEQLLPTRRA
jgi:transcriptional regulator with XRE-family HTH domain